MKTEPEEHDFLAMSKKGADSLMKSTAQTNHTGFLI